MKDLFEIISLIYLKEIVNLDDLSKMLFFDMDKIVRLITIAKDKELIEKLGNYKVTKKGLEFLNKHKVDNAVIMAAGFGSRFVPMTYEKPKGLLEVHGEVMIERQIRQLLEVGIVDITVVVGYLKETFEYLTDKFGVKLIYNPDYSIKNNISSLFYAQNEMKNTYLLTSDIYMPKNLFRKYEYESFYAVEYFEEHTDEWAVKLNSDNLIETVNPSGGKNTWAMNGPVFLKEHFSKKLIKYIENIYNDKSCAQWYWEDVYIRHINELHLYARKYPLGSVLEFESLEELRRFDKSYLKFSRSEILDVIKKVFNVELSSIIGITTLKEGMTNDSFLFEVNTEKYVFRNPGVGTDLLINRYQEKDVYDLIHKLNISDEVVYLDPQTGYKITKFISDSRVIDVNNVEEVNLALEKLRFLHNSGLIVSHEFDIEERIGFYLKLCQQSNAILFNDFDEVYKNIKKVLKYINGLNRNKVLCHIDSVCVNFLISNKEVFLLDWEYAGMADPLIDLAMYIVYGGLQDDEIKDFIDLYFERIHTNQELLIVHSYVALAGFLWSLWTQYKQASGEDFGTYGMEQYQYGRKYSRIVLKGINYA